MKTRLGYDFTLHGEDTILKLLPKKVTKRIYNQKLMERCYGVILGS